MRAQVGLLFCAQGFARMETPGGEVILGPRDALLGCGDDTVWRLGAGSSGRAFLIEIENVGPNTA